MKQKKKILAFCLLSLLFIGCDQVTKNLARIHLQNREPRSYFHDTLRFLYTQNTGAFLSFGSDWPPLTAFFVFTILPLCFLSALLLYAIRKSGESSYPFIIALGLVFSGGTGNLIDRLLFNKQVTDFMYIGIGELKTGIFNVADLCITMGVLLFLVVSIPGKMRPRGD